MAVITVLPHSAKAQNTGIAPGGCVLPGGGLPPGISGSPKYFSALLAEHAARANAKRNSQASARSRQLVAAFNQVSSEMENALAGGELVSAFRQYLVFRDNAERYQRDVDGMEAEVHEVKSRLQLVLNYAVTTATRAVERDPSDSEMMMTLMEIANMPQISKPSQRSLQVLSGHEKSPGYKEALATFKAKYSIDSLVPQPSEQKEENGQAADR
jgi:hypothetical protein